MRLSFNSIDIVILQSINAGKGYFFNTGVTINKIIWYCDAIDRTNLEYDQLVNALGKFLTIEFIAIKNNKIYVTKEFSNQKKKYCRKTSNSYDEYLELQKLLQLYAETDYEILDSVSNWFLNEKIFEIEKKTYQLEFQELLAKFK